MSEFRGFLHIPPKRCIRGFGQAFGVSESLRCYGMGILRRLLRHETDDVSKSVPSEPLFSQVIGRTLMCVCGGLPLGGAAARRAGGYPEGRTRMVESLSVPRGRG